MADVYRCDKHPWCYYSDGEECPACGDNFDGLMAMVDEALEQD